MEWQNITELEVYKAARNDIARRRHLAIAINDKSILEHGHENEFCVKDIDKLTLQLDEIYFRILSLEGKI